MPAHYSIVEGLVVPAPVGGHPALDFCNTRAGWDGFDEGEFLVSYDHLAVWAGSAGLLSVARVAGLRARAAGDPPAAGRVLDAARAARARVYRALGDPGDSEAIAELAPELRPATDRLVLGLDGGAARFAIDETAGLAAPLLAALWSAGELLVSDERARVRVCPGHGCGWLFLDRSGRRRWCTMATCGNRAKQRRLAGRRRVAEGEDRTA